MLTIFQAFSEFERDLIVERTNEGLKSARAKGRVGGRPKKADKNIQQALKLYDSKLHTVREIEKLSSVSESTLYRYIRKRKNS